MSGHRIVVAESERAVAEDLRNCLIQMGFLVPAIAGTTQEVLRLVREIRPDLVVMDSRLRDDAGPPHASALIQTELEIPLVLLTARPEDTWADTGPLAHPVACILKPFDARELRGAIGMVLHQQETIRRLQECERWIECSMRNLEEAVIILDTRGCVRFLNPMALTLAGLSESESMGNPLPRTLEIRNQTGAGVLDLHLLDALKGGKESCLPDVILEPGQGPGGPHVDAKITPMKGRHGDILGAILTFRDASEKRRSEAQFLRAQRMESIGALAGGIAHDLNNILTPVLMGIQFLQTQVADEPARQMMAMIETSAQRGAEMVRQILAISRGSEGDRIPIQPRYLLKEIEKISQETFPKNIRLHLEIPKDLRNVQGDPTRLHQALLALCMHVRGIAAEGGTITARAANVDLDSSLASNLPGAVPGPHVTIAFSCADDGVPDIRECVLLDPIGLEVESAGSTFWGLTAVQVIVRGHGGFLLSRKSLAGEACLLLLLPALHAPEILSLQLPPVERLRGQGELVLIVDDESAIRDVLRSTLEGSGYRVLTAEDGAEAVALYAQRGKEIAVVLLDVVMPIMDGLASIRALRKIAPEVRIITMSGLVDEPRLAALSDIRVEAFLTKPLTVDNLLVSLHRVLHSQIPSE